MESVTQLNRDGVSRIHGMPCTGPSLGFGPAESYIDSRGLHGSLSKA